jgi:hypothetical protein
MTEEITTIEETGSQETPTAEAEGENDGTKKKSIMTFEKKLHIIRTAVLNALKPTAFRQYIEEFGFNEEKLNGGMNLVTGTETARTNQQQAIALKLQATRDARLAKIEADKIYMHFLIIGREEFRDNPHLLDLLGFNGSRKEDFGGWKAQTMMLYENLNTPGVLEGYANHNITPENLDAGKQAVMDAENVVTAKKEAKATAEKATEDKDKIYKQLLEWWRDFVKVVNIALKKDPQLKEQVNIVAPSFR